MKEEILKRLKEAKEIEKDFFELIDNTKYKPNNYSFTQCKINDENEDKQRKLFRKYKIWYELSLKIINELGSKYSKSFSQNYSDIRKAILLFEGYSEDSYYKSIKKRFIRAFDLQIEKLEVLIPLIELEKKQFKKEITFEILDNEKYIAKSLLKNNLIRPAGVIAGVILEKFIKSLCKENEINFNKNATLGALIENAYTSNKIKWLNVTKKKELEHLTSIRDTCAHDKEKEPEKNEVEELINKVDLLLFAYGGN